MTPTRPPSRARIQNRLAVAFLAVTTIPLVVVAIYSAHVHLSALEDIARSSAARQAMLEGQRMQAALDAAASDLFFLTQMPSLSAYIGVEGAADDADATFSREKLAKQFEAFIAARDAYRAACYSDEAGREIIRAEPAAPVTTLPSASEPSDAARRITSRARGLLAGQTLTLVDRAGEGGVFFVTRVLPRGMERRGYVWLEASLSTLWSSEGPPHRDTGTLVLDEDDRVILGDAGGLEPQQLAALKAHPHEPIESSQGRLLTLVPLSPQHSDAERTWSLVTVEPAHAAFGELQRYRWVFTGVLIATLLLGAVMSVVLSRQFTKPLTKLYDAARQIGQGNLDVDLHDVTGDEIGGLAAELSVMASKLQVKRDEMQEEIDEKTRELLDAERLSTIGTMSAAIAHEVHNPLGIISMYSQMLAEQIAPDDPRGEKLKVISREAGRIALLVRGLLQFARRPDPVMRTIRLGPLLAEAVDAVTGLDEHTQRVRITVTAPPGDHEIDADPDQLQQVLRNLLINACQAIPDEGAIDVSVEADGPDHVVLRVHDTGKGIEPELLGKLFEPFFTTKRFGTGTGLGLAIAKEIIDRHGGTIGVTSELGRGTTFTIRLPRKRSDDAASNPPEGASPDESKHRS